MRPAPFLATLLAVPAMADGQSRPGGLGAFVIAVGTIAGHAVRASPANPIHALQHE